MAASACQQPSRDARRRQQEGTGAADPRVRAPEMSGVKTFHVCVSVCVRTEEGGAALRPDIYYCRSPNMEHFNCWWRPLGNLTEGEVTYTLTYSIECVLHP